VNKKWKQRFQYLFTQRLWVNKTCKQLVSTSCSPKAVFFKRLWVNKKWKLLWVNTLGEQKTDTLGEQKVETALA